jgi:hypothetical protein
LLNLEPESSHAEDIPERLHLYSTLLHRRHELPVHSVVLLLRREANARNLTGVLELRLPGQNEPYDVFRYQVIRLWEESLARLLAGGLGTLPLAPLTDEGSTNLPEVFRHIDERLRQEATPPRVRHIGERLRQEAMPPRAAKLWAATFVLMGLRYPAELSEQLFQGVTTMEESTTYQLIVKRGRIQEARAFLLRMGRSKFGGPADAVTTAALEQITDLERLETLGERLLHVSNWQELLAEPSAS